VRDRAEHVGILAIEQMTEVSPTGGVHAQGRTTTGMRVGEIRTRG
jgi:hypothetical protein